jgi:hypothetical protein
MVSRQLLMARSFTVSVLYLSWLPIPFKPGGHNTADKLLNYKIPIIQLSIHIGCLGKFVILLLHLTTDINDSICSFLGTLEHE